jgi:Arc/MetJ-type ribon-helix-helix transcriptional regulator
MAGNTAVAVATGAEVAHLPVGYGKRTTNRVTLRNVGTLTIRTDAEVERALEALTSEGRSRSEVIRAAILLAAREARRERMRAEADALRNDPDDVVKSRDLAAEMDEIRAW